ncbi:envelope stress response membrane protein PspC [Candidatus Sumerlaeota bacterium]|nr:envelope stress response membrane protein PspC [Candidatus Sumerlaeota bacterium]
MTHENGAWKRGLYRSRRGVILGVCRGVAEYLDFPVFWLRILVVAGVIFTGFFPVVVTYFVAGILMKPEPVIPFESESDREFYESYVSSRGLAIHRLKRTFESLDRRIRRMESIVTSRDFSWDKRLNQ